MLSVVKFYFSSSPARLFPNLEGANTRPTRPGLYGLLRSLTARLWLSSRKSMDGHFFQKLHQAPPKGLTPTFEGPSPHFSRSLYLSCSHVHLVKAESVGFESVRQNATEQAGLCEYCLLHNYPLLESKYMSEFPGALHSLTLYVRYLTSSPFKFVVSKYSNVTNALNALSKEPHGPE